MEKSNNKSGRAKEIIGLALIIFSFFLMVSLASHRASDYGGLVYPVSDQTHNKGGIVGAFASYHLLMNFGLASFAFALAFGFWGVMLFLKGQISGLWWKASSAAAFVLSFASFLGMLFPQMEEGYVFFGSTVSLGGLIGLASGNIVYNLVGGIGGFPIVFALMAASLYFATDGLVKGLYAFIWQASRTGSVWLGIQLKNALFAGVKMAGEKGVDMAKRLDEWRARKLAEKEALNKMETPPAAKQAADYMESVRSSEQQEGPMALPPIQPIQKMPEISRPEPVPVQKPAPALSSADDDDYDLPVEEFEDKKEPLPAIVRQSKPKAELAPPAPAVPTNYKLPPLEMLDDSERSVQTSSDEKDIEDRRAVIEKTLASFDIQGKVVGFEKGPVLTKYELELAPGIRSHKIVSMADDLAIALKAPNVQIVAPIPGKSTIGIDVPNLNKDIVKLKEVITETTDAWSRFKLPLFLGKDASGADIVKDLSEMPHLLIAGTTGSGKSVCINAIIMSQLLTRTPEELKFILIDPKMVELSVYKDIPHLMCPVVTEMKKAPIVLDWVVRQMEERYELFNMVGVKKIETYNQLGEEKLRKMLKADSDEEGDEDFPVRLPHIVVVVDELADLMMTFQKEVEGSITRIAQKSRAVGIHMVLATQRPSVDVITGLIKSNITSRIAFKVAAKVDSRTILDRNGADTLLGKGDMLMLMPNSTDIVRGQCVFESDRGIQDVVAFWKEQGSAVFDKDLVNRFQSKEDPTGAGSGKDELFEEAVKIILESQRGSVSLLQRKLAIGYTRSARLIEMIAAQGILGPYKEAKAREVIISVEEWEARRSRGDYAAITGAPTEDEMVESAN